MTDKQIIIEDCPYFIGGNCQEYLDGVCENHKCDLKIIRELEQQLKRAEAELEQETALKETYLACYKTKHEDIEGKLFKLSKTLTEIKEIADNYTKRNYADFKFALQEILQKISECEGNDGKY